MIFPCAIQRLNRKIKKLQETELTLEDMDSEDTNYVLEEQYVVSRHYHFMHACYIFTLTVCIVHSGLPVGRP